MDIIMNSFDGEVADSQIERWLEQFEPSERPYIIRLLPSFRYYSLRRFEKLIRTLPEKIKQATGKNPTDLIYVPIGNVGDSGALSLYLYRQAINLPPSQTLSSLDDLHNSEGKPLVLIDDYIETGTHGNSFWCDHIKSLHLPEQTILIAVVGTTDGEQYLRLKTGLSLVVGEIFDPPRPLQAKSELFDEKERKILVNIMRKYAGTLLKGVSSRNIELGSLVGFFYNTPNSTFPIFWSTAVGWKPLLPHRSDETYEEEIYGSKHNWTVKLRRSQSLVQAIEDSKLSDEIIKRLLQEFKDSNIVKRISSVFLALSLNEENLNNLFDLVDKLMYATHEKTTVRSALFIPETCHLKEYALKSLINVETGLRIEKADKVETIATVFDGLAVAMIVTPTGEVLGSIGYGESYETSSLIPRRYMKAVATSKDGLLLLFLGQGRAQMFWRGEILATHRGANWYQHSRDDLDAMFSNLAKTHEIDELALRKLMRIVYLISDQERGALITMGKHEEVINIGKRTDSDGYSWRKVNINNSLDAALVGLMSQDKATIVTADGVVLQGRTTLYPPRDTDVDEEAGKGTKHNAAAQVSLKTGAICIAVGSEGVISIYSKGERVYRTII